MPSHLSRIRTRGQALDILDRDLDDFRTRNRTEIPKIIHQIYRNASIPDVYSPYIKSWIKHNPDFKYYFWDDTSGPKFVRKYYKEFAPLYEAYCHDLMRSDALRYFVLHKYGGIYADADYESFKPIHELLRGSQCSLVQEHWAQAKLLYNTDLLVQNSFMASTPAHPFIHFVINNLPTAAPVGSCKLSVILSATGPFLLDKSRQSYESACNKGACKLQILPSSIMMPHYDMDRKGRAIFYRWKCGSPAALRKLDESGRAACAYFRKYHNELPLIGPEVYASHKFLHIGNEAHHYRAKKYTNILTLVPGVIFPEV